MVKSKPYFQPTEQKLKKFWWTWDLNLAIVFINKDTAEKALESIKFNKPKIITLQEAGEIRANERIAKIKVSL